MGRRRHREGRASTTTSAPIPAFEGGKPASPFIGVNGFYLASNGKNKTLAQEFATNFVPTADFQSGLYAADPRRPALTESATAAAAADPNIAKFAAPEQRHDPARDPGDGPGLEAVRHRRGGDRRAGPTSTALKAAAKAIRDGIANQ